ncbi:hypothetical protein HC023_28615, partial [Streptomyces sp. NEAU-H3]|nr:hypothetical protein [Streptomyces sp. NEAU-H3]
MRGSGGGARALPALLLGVLLLLVTACSGGGDGGTGTDGKDGGKVRPSPTLSQAVVTVAPKDGAKDVDTSGVLKITAGTEVAGDIVRGG